MDQPPKMSISRGTFLGATTNSTFRWSTVGEVTESLSLGSRSIAEFYPELRVNVGVPSETADFGGSPECRSPSGRNAFTANGCIKQDKVKVFVRMRPFGESEKVCPLKQVLCLIGDTIVVRDLDHKLTGNSKEPPHKAATIEFKVDYMQDDSYLQVHSEIHKEESQKRMYGALGVPCIESALDGYNTTILAYGQTGSGKTYTMMGDRTKAGRGLIPRLANDLMTKINEESNNGILYAVQVSYLEIYQEKIRDLLAEDEVEEEVKPPLVPQPSLYSGGLNSDEKIHITGSSNLEEKLTTSSRGSLIRNSYTSSFLNKAALHRQLEAAYQKQARIMSDGAKSTSSSYDGGSNKAKSPKAKPAFETVFNGQKIHKHYRTFPTVMEEAVPVRKQTFLKIREHPITGPFVEGLLWKDVCTWYDMENLMKQGSKSRTTASTDMNDQSSRSHAVFSIKLTRTLGPDLLGVQPSTVSYINLVDLAGSEKLPKLCSGAVTGQRTQEESRCINQSLSQLNEVILSLSRSTFVSYRNSVLTWLLKESLGGNSRTFMVANISPTEKDLRESINTLRYATTASRIPPPAALDQDPRNKLIKKLKEEICSLRTLLLSFTSVKDNAPSNEHPSMHGFKVPCLDVGLQVEYNPRDDCNFGKRLYELLDRGSQTGNHFEDNQQDSISRSFRSVDTGFQKILEEHEALNVSKQTLLKDGRGVDNEYRTLTLNICAHDFGSQAYPTDFGVMNVGHQVNLRDLGTINVSQQTSWKDCGPKDVYLQSILHNCSAVDVGEQTTLQDCGAVDVANQIALRDWGDVDVGQQTSLKGCRAVDIANQVALRDQGDVNVGQQTPLSDCGAVTVGNQFAPRGWQDVNPGQQTTLRDCGAVDVGNQIALRVWGDVNVGQQTSLRDCGTAHVGNQIALRDLGDVDVGQQTASMGCCGAVATGHQMQLKSWENVDAGHQITLRDWGNVDAENQTTLQDWGDVNAGNQISLQDWGGFDAGNQLSLRGSGTVDSGLQISCRDCGPIDVGNQITLRDWGTLDNACQTNAHDCRANYAGLQTRFQDHVVNKTRDCTIVQVDAHDWRDFRASDAFHQFTPQKYGALDIGYQVSWVDFGASDSGNQVIWTDFCSSNVGHQIEAEHMKHFDQGQHNNLRDCMVGDSGLQVSCRNLNFDFGQQVSWTEFSAIEIHHQVNSTGESQMDPDQQLHGKSYESINVQPQTYSKNIGNNHCKSQMNLGQSDGLDNGHQITPRILLPIDTGMQMDWNDFEALGDGHQIIHCDIDGGHENKQNDLGMMNVGSHTMCNIVGGIDPGQQTNRGYPLPCDVELRTSGTEFETHDAGNQLVTRKYISDFGQQITFQDCGVTDLGFPIHWNYSDLKAVTNGCHCWAMDAQQQTSKSKQVATIDGQISLLHQSRAHNNGSQMISKGTKASHIGNQADQKCIGAGDGGHQKLLSGLGAVDILHKTSLKVSVTKEQEEQVYWNDLNALELFHQRTLPDGVDVIPGQPAALEGLQAVDIARTSLKTRGAEEKASQVDWKYLEVGPQKALQDCGAINTEQQTNFEDLGAVNVCLQTNWENIGVKDTQNQVGWRAYARVDVGCQATFEEQWSVTSSHQSTSMDFWPLGTGDQTSFGNFRAIEAWKHFQCGVCGATPDNSVVGASNMMPIPKVTQDVGLQLNWIHFHASDDGLQTPRASWGTSSDVTPTTPMVLGTVDECSQEELHPLHRQHQGSWKYFGTYDCRHQIALKACKSHDHEVNCQAVREGPCKHWEEDKICITGCQICEQDYVAQKWRYQDCQVGRDCVAHNLCQQACKAVGQDPVTHNWQQHWDWTPPNIADLTEIMLPGPSYLVTDSYCDTSKSDEETTWNAVGRDQNSQICHGDLGVGLDFSKDIILTHVRARNVGHLQCTETQRDDIGIQSDSDNSGMVDVEQQGGSSQCNNTQLGHNTTEQSLNSVTGKTQSFNRGDDEAVDATPQTQTIWEDKWGACGFSQRTKLQRLQFGMETDDLQTLEDDYKSGQCLTSKLGCDQDSFLLSWLSDFIQKKDSVNVPVEEAFHLCSLWTLAKLRGRMEQYSNHSERNSLRSRASLPTKCPGLVSKSTIFSKAEVATQKDSCPEDFREHRPNLSNIFLHICSLWVFVILRIAATDKMPQGKGKRWLVQKSPFLAAPGKIKVLDCLSSVEGNERCFKLREYHSPKPKHLRYSGVEPVTFKSTTPFFIQSPGDCSLLKTRQCPQTGNTARRLWYKIMCRFESHRVVHFLKDGVNRLGSNKGAHIYVKGFSEDHTEFIHMPANRCIQKKGYVVARLVAPGAMALLNGQPMLEHKELCTGDVLVLRDIRYQSSVCTLHFFDLVKVS